MTNSAFFASSVFFSAYVTSDMLGKIIFLALFALSFLTWLILIQKVLQYNEVKKQSHKFQEVVTNYEENVLNIPNETLGTFTLQKKSNSFIRIYLSLKSKTTQILEKNYFFKHPQLQTSRQDRSVFLSRADVDLIEDQLNIVITKEAKFLEKNLFILSTAVSLAPFLGILGTVWGVLVSLGDLQNGGGAHSNSVVLAGLSTALATTVLGLFIAIPALISYNYLRNSLKIFYAEMHDFSHLLLANVELQYRKVDLLE